MLLCPSCKHPYPTDKPSCNLCGFSPEHKNGFVSWAPTLDTPNEDFRPENFEYLAGSEGSNFWFAARNELIVWSIEKYFPNFTSLLEVGCGTGFVLSGIAERFPQARLVGSEIFSQGLAFASKRLPSVDLVQADARCLPYEAEFDITTAFDVIEHIEEDELVLADLFRATKHGGGCLITVPQHEWLWSPVDEEACHKRRYTAELLHRRVEQAGFRIVRSTSFVSFLLPIMLISRLKACYAGEANADDELRPGRAANKILKTLMDVERVCVRLGLSFPLGGSRLVVARKDKR